MVISLNIGSRFKTLHSRIVSTARVTGIPVVETTDADGRGAPGPRPVRRRCGPSRNLDTCLVAKIFVVPHEA